MEKGKRNVVLFGITSFFNDLSSEMILPILPFFLSSLGASPVLIGLIGGLRDSIGKILRIFFGYYSDKTGQRKKLIFGGYGLSAAFKILLAFSPGAAIAAAFASLERVGKSMRDAPRDAMISRFMPKKSGEGFGIHQMLDTAGAVAGSVLVLLLIVYLSLGYSTIILIAGSIAVLSIIPLFFIEGNGRKRTDMKFLQSLSEITKKQHRFNLTASVFALANFSYMFFLIRAGAHQGFVVPLLLYVLFNIFYSAFAYPMGRYSDRIGKRNMLMFGYGLFALVSFAFVYFSDITALVFLFIFYGISNAAVKAVERAYATDLSSDKIKGTSIGLFQMMTGIAAIPSGIIAGFLWEISPEYTFLFGGVLAAAAVLLLLRR